MNRILLASALLGGALATPTEAAVVFDSASVQLNGGAVTIFNVFTPPSIFYQTTGAASQAAALNPGPSGISAAISKQGQLGQANAQFNASINAAFAPNNASGTLTVSGSASGQAESSHLQNIASAQSGGYVFHYGFVTDAPAAFSIQYSRTLTTPNTPPAGVVWQVVSRATGLAVILYGPGNDWAVHSGVYQAPSPLLAGGYDLYIGSPLNESVAGAYAFPTAGAPGGGDKLTQSFSTTQTISFSIGAGNLNGAVPEPATWAMMILGFGLVGSAMRRRAYQVNVT